MTTENKPHVDNAGRLVRPAPTPGAAPPAPHPGGSVSLPPRSEAPDPTELLELLRMLHRVAWCWLCEQLGAPDIVLDAFARASELLERRP